MKTIFQLNKIYLILLFTSFVTGCAELAELKMPEMPKNINDDKNAINEFNKQTYKIVTKDEFLKEYKMIFLDRT